jgi:hypothetical protein
VKTENTVRAFLEQPNQNCWGVKWPTAHIWRFYLPTKMAANSDNNRLEDSDKIAKKNCFSKTAVNCKHHLSKKTLLVVNQGMQHNLSPCIMHPTIVRKQQEERVFND